MAKVLRSVIAESNTIPAIEGSRSAYIRAVIAKITMKKIKIPPIDLPHSPIVETFPHDLKYSITHDKSSHSKCPKLM